MNTIPNGRCGVARWSLVGMTLDEMQELGRKRILAETDPEYAEYGPVYCNPACCKPRHLRCLGCKHPYHDGCAWTPGQTDPIRPGNLNPVPCSACLMYRDILRGTLTFEKDAEARILYDECERQARILYDECQLEDTNRQAKFRALFQYSLVAQPENWIPTTSAPTVIESKQRHNVSEPETDLSAEPQDCMPTTSAPTAIESKQRHNVSEPETDLSAEPQDCMPTTSAPTAIESKQRHDVSESETDLSAEPPTHVAECDTHTFRTEVAKCCARFMRQQKRQRQRKRQRLCRKLQEKRNEEARRNVIIIE